jgi:hypothetical protein
MDEMWRENKWKDWPKEVYRDVSCKDAPVPPTFPVPNSDCGKATHVTQSMHPDTAARAYYSCPDYRVSTFHGFFLIYNISWIERLNDELKCLFWCKTGRCAIFLVDWWPRDGWPKNLAF